MTQKKNLVSDAHMFSSPRKKVISRALRRALDGYEKNYFTGPPESTRDTCVVAARALTKGNWKRTEELLFGLPAWSLLQNSEQVKAMLKKKIQEVDQLNALLLSCRGSFDADICYVVRRDCERTSSPTRPTTRPCPLRSYRASFNYPGTMVSICMGLCPPRLQPITYSPPSRQCIAPSAR